MDEIYTFVLKKRKRDYVWTAVAVTQTKRYFYFYHLSHDKGSGALFTFKDDLPEVEKIYTDGHYITMSYLALKPQCKNPRLPILLKTSIHR